MALDYQRELDAICARCAPGPERQRAYAELAQRVSQSRARASLVQIRHTLSMLVRQTKERARKEQGQR
jgi:hypothetical protein